MVIIFKGLLLKQIIKKKMEGEDPTLKKILSDMIPCYSSTQLITSDFSL